jgi:hypothetical protein
LIAGLYQSKQTTLSILTCLAISTCRRRRQALRKIILSTYILHKTTERMLILTSTGADTDENRVDEIKVKHA